MLRHWVEFHYYDLERDPMLLEKLEQFMGSARSRNMQKLVMSIHRTLKKVCGSLLLLSRLGRLVRGINCIQIEAHIHKSMISVTFAMYIQC